MRQQGSGNRIVPVGENVRLDTDLVADGAFCGKAAAIDFRRDSFNNDASASFCLVLSLSSQCFAVRFLLFNQLRVELDGLVRNCCPAEHLFDAPPTCIAKAPALLRVAEQLC